MAEQSTEGLETQHDAANGDLVINDPAGLEGAGETAPASVADWKPVVAAHFPNLVPVVEACLANVCCLLLEDLSNCPALVLIGPPSSLKTTALSFFSTPFTYHTDNFTPASFVSHAANMDRTKLKEIDLLPRIRYKVVLVPDLAPFFSRRADDLQQGIGVLTRVLDGQGYQSDSGAHGQRGYQGDYKFGLMAATTPLDGRIWQAMSRLGPRLLFLHIDAQQESVGDQVRKLMSDGSYQDKVDVCRSAVSSFLENLWARHGEFGGFRWQKSADDEQLIIQIVQLASLGASLRSQPAREKLDINLEIQLTSAMVEGPERYQSLLYNLARGHALSEGRTRLAIDDVKIVAGITLSSGQEERRRLLNAVLASEQPIGTNVAANIIGCTGPTARAVAQDMEKLGILSVDGRNVINIDLAEQHQWLRKLSGNADPA